MYCCDPHTLVPKPIENECLDNSYLSQTFILHDRLAKWLRRLSYISYVGASQKVAGSIPASIIDFLRFQFFSVDVVSIFLVSSSTIFLQRCEKKSVKYRVKRNQEGVV